MRSIFQWTYTLLLVSAAFVLLIYMSKVQALHIDDPLAFAGFTLLAVFTISWGFPAPYVGHTSLDRVVQVSTLLIFGPLQAAWMNGLASLIWPFLARNNQPLSRSALRALHNTGMMILVILASGYLYKYMGGLLPLTRLSWEALMQIVLMVVFMQALNQVMMAVMLFLDGLDFRKALSLILSMIELASVPLAVFTAVIYNRMELSVFGLFMVVLILIVLIVRGFADARTAQEKRVDELLAINRVGKAINHSLKLDDVVELIFQECRKLLDFSAFYLVLYDEENKIMDFRLHHNEQGRMPRIKKPLGEGLIGWIIENNKPLLIENWQYADSEIRNIAVIVGEAPSAFVGVPVTFRDKVLGAITVQNFVPYTLNKSHLNLMLTFADQAAVAIANARLFEELALHKQELEQRVEERTSKLAQQAEELHILSGSLRSANDEKEKLVRQLQLKTQELDRQSKEDSLTGLYNRRYMDERVALELQRAERYDRAIAVAMADLDHFKGINDRYSHAIGDQVLRVVADLLRKQCRAIDVISRYGGEEFVLCFPETDMESALMVCEKIRKSIAAFDWNSVYGGLQVTISIGVANAPPGYDPVVLLENADKMLYEAKRGGRNRVSS